MHTHPLTHSLTHPCTRQAFEIAPDNPLVIFERARVLLCLGNYKAALEDAERLKALAPKEPSLYFLLEKIYRKVWFPPPPPAFVCRLRFVSKIHTHTQRLSTHAENTRHVCIVRCSLPPLRCAAEAV